MSPLLGYDSTRPGLIPATAAVVFPYADGRFAWTEQQLARFGHARKRMITVLGNAKVASICDVENGDVPAAAPGSMAAADQTATSAVRLSEMDLPSQVLSTAITAAGSNATVAARLAAKAVTARSFIIARANLPGGGDGAPVIYCNRTTLAVVQAHCAGLQYRVWLATLDGTRPRYYNGAAIVAIQYTDHNGEYDITEIYDEEWPR